MDPHFPLQDVPGIAQMLKRADVGGAEQTTVMDGYEHRDGCKSRREPFEPWKG